MIRFYDDYIHINRENVFFGFFFLLNINSSVAFILTRDELRCVALYHNVCDELRYVTLYYNVCYCFTVSDETQRGNKSKQIHMF